MIDSDVNQKALEKVRENGWTALKSQYIRCYKAGADLMVEFFMRAVCTVHIPARNVSLPPCLYKRCTAPQCGKRRQSWQRSVMALLRSQLPCRMEDRLKTTN